MLSVIRFALIGLFIIAIPGCQASQADVKQQPSQVVPEPQPQQSPAPAPQSDSNTAAPQGPAGQIKFESVTHDFGNIDPNSKNPVDFKFTNTGKGTLHIGTIESTCGCTIFDLKKFDYAPGESGTIKVEYHANKTAGPIMKMLHVPTNDPNNKNVELVLKANIVLNIEAKPDSLELSLFKPNGGASPIIITAKDNKPFSIKSFESSNNTITAQFDPDASATKFIIPLTVDAEKLKTMLNGYMRFSLTHPVVDEVTIQYRALAEYSIQPTSLILRNAIAGQPITREIWVKSNYNRPFEIESIVSKNGFIKVAKQEKLDNVYKLTVDVVPPEKTQIMFSDALQIKIKDSPVNTISCRGFYQKQK